MKFVSRIVGFVVSSALACSCLSGAAYANATVQVNETGLGNGVWSGSLQLPVQSSAANFWTGFQKIHVNYGTSSASFLAFCLDPFQWSSSTPTTYTQSTLDAYFSTATVNRITQLVDYGYASTLAGPNANLNAGAMQLALWEVANDDGNLHSGGVRATSGTNAALVHQTNTFLSNSASYAGPSLYSFTFFKSSTQQDFVVVTPVPEPTTYAMMLAGMCLLGTMALRRRKFS